MSGFDGPSAGARLGFSFPQPADAEESENETNRSEATDDVDVDIQSRAIEPIATHADVPEITGIADEHDGRNSNVTAAPPETGLGPPPMHIAPSSKSTERESFVTAAEGHNTSRDRHNKHNLEPDQQEGDHGDRRISAAKSDHARPTPQTEDSFLVPSTESDPSPRLSGLTNSTTALLPGEDPDARLQGSKRDSLEQAGREPVQNEGPASANLGRISTGVRFKVSEGIADRRDRISRRVDSAHLRSKKKRFRRDTLQEGAIVKMEKMLVRVDTTLQQLPSDFDENEGIKIETRAIEKWREFMIVCRRSRNDDADFRLQAYKTRVIPEIENETVKKKPAHEIYLRPRTTRVNLYSSLDKTIVIWHPYKKGTRIVILKPRSAAHAVAWYTFIKDALGWERPSSLQIHVPDLGLSLQLENPFQGLAEAQQAIKDADEVTALTKSAEAEQAVAAKIIKQCIDMLEGNPEWSSVLEKWSSTQKMGLAWKRYDRLEWVHGVAEQKMYGSMAMERSYDLELRPKHHYPTHTHGKKGKHHEEPAPVEGFLIRLTSQKGIHQRMGRAFFKRLYFSTHNQFLVFNRPAKVTPPHPPRLATITGRNIPSSNEIVRQTPTMFDIDPYAMRDGEVTWLSSSNRDHVRGQDQSAYEESQRNIKNLSEADGFINMNQIVKIRKMKWGANDMDEEIEEGSGSDVEFHQEVTDTLQEDGETNKLDEDRVFELVLENGLVIRLQAYNPETRHEWIRRLRKLVKYWKLRIRADMDMFKEVRKSNLDNLNIDEGMEAVLGQYARKWEVNHTEASPQLYNMCGISCCRSISMSGMLYRKPRRHATFQRCGVLLAGGQLLIFHATMRKMTGEQVKHIHQQRQQAIDLRDCYVYSGLITDDDLLYHNQTFDSNHPGMHALPRVYLEDGWTSQDEDTMTCFVVWHALKKSLFRAVVGEKEDGGKRQKLRQVSRLGVPGRSIVFKCRSRAERDHWVMNVGMEIDRLQLVQDEEVRVEGGKK